ncbi:hypothetical protein Rhal01_01530 [Rubritalea halochordaticola]|uniref:endo-1,4-beta-xylanase n=1 Tax=Rubritalea halochordaticola TaxID=714537 RepID=A0ABP9V061_9BACT
MLTRSLSLIILCLTTIAPTLTAQTIVDVPVSADTWVNDARPTRAYGDSSKMRLKSSGKIGFLQFDVEGIPGTILSAELHLYTLSTTSEITIHDVADDTWDENQLMWDNKPDITILATATGSTTANSYTSYDLGNLINMNGLHSLALQTSSTSFVDLGTREASQGAFLRITYDNSNVAPEGKNDEFYVIHDTSRTISQPGVLSNDTDANDDAITAVLESTTTKGSLALSADGSFVYTPTPGQYGTDSFTYRVSDGNFQSDPVTVTLYLRGRAILLSDAERDQLENDLGITLGLDQELDLIWAVDPPPADSSRLDQAHARIEQHRKSDFTLQIMDANGNALQNATIHASLKKRKFRFGGVLSLKHFASADTDGHHGQAYKDKIKTYFDAVGLMNGLKPKLSGGFEEYLPDFFDWCSNHDVPVRGHLLLWPGGSHLSPDIEAKTTAIEESEDPIEIATLTDELRTLVDNEITSWAAKWDVYEWDVLNEILSNQRLQNIFGDAEMIRWYNLAEQYKVNPDADLLLNDFQIISGKNDNRIATYKERLDYLINNGAPITAIGFQSRFKWQQEDPETLYDRLEQFSSYNMSLVGTEFEIKTTPDVFEPDEYLRARMTAEIMTSYFSHPKVTALFAWDFGKDYSERALIDQNGDPKLNGLVWYYLSRIRFNTSADTNSNTGTAQFRGIHGEYEITIEHEGRSYSTTVNLLDNNTQAITIPFAAAESREYSVEADTFAFENNPDLSPENWQRLELRTQADGPYTRIAFLRFDLHGLHGTNVSTILKLYSELGTDSLSVHLVEDSSWNAQNLSWNNKPALGTKLTTVISQDEAWTEIPLSLSQSNSGYLTLALVNDNDTLAKISSSESSNPPSLLVTNTFEDNDLDGQSDLLDDDDDNDNLPDSYEARHGLDYLNITDGKADHDLDGISTALEFVLGLSASQAGDSPVNIEHSADGSTALSYQLRQNEDLIGGTLSLEFSTELTSWQPLNETNLSSAGLSPLIQQSIKANPDGDLESFNIQLPDCEQIFIRAKVQTSP